MSVERGTAALLTRRREILAQGAEPLGWKIGFNVPATQKKLGIDAPLAGFLTTDSLVEGSWDEYPVIVESEVALEVGADGTLDRRPLPSARDRGRTRPRHGRSSRSSRATSSTEPLPSGPALRRRSPVPRASS